MKTRHFYVGCWEGLTEELVAAGYAFFGVRVEDSSGNVVRKKFIIVDGKSTAFCNYLDENPRIIINTKAAQETYGVPDMLTVHPPALDVSTKSRSKRLLDIFKKYPAKVTS